MKIQFLLICAFFLSTMALAEHEGPAVTVSLPAINVDSIFQKYKKRHAETIETLKEAALTLQRLQKEKKNPPTIILSVALASELLRLKKEEPLIKLWEDGTIDKAGFVTLMAENAFVLENLKMFAAFAKSNYEAWEKVEGPVTEAELANAAAKGFDKYYTEKDKLSSAYYDVELRELGTEGRKTLDVFKQVFGKDETERNAFRADHFAQYAENLIQKNEALIHESKPKAK